ncbi:MAG: ester cyclase [Chloroflexota bacterium]
MLEKRNKTLVRRIVEEVLNRGRLEVIDELVDESFVLHSHGLEGRDAFKRLVRDIRRAFPDLHCEIELMIAEDDLVAMRLTTTHTHLGPFMGVAPTGVHGSHSGMSFVRVVDSRAVEHWEEADMLGLLQQLGALPQEVM